MITSVFGALMDTATLTEVSIVLTFMNLGMVKKSGNNPIIS
jgi:hypothetical protein